jgi:hypothetical protein
MLWTKMMGIMGMGAFILAAIGCETAERPRGGTPPDGTTSGRERAESTDFDSLERYTYDQRSEFQRESEEALDALDRRLDEWRRESRDVSANTRDAWNAAVADLRVKRENLRRSFARMREATADNWDDLKGSVRRAWEDFEDSFERASARFD